GPTGYAVETSALVDTLDLLGPDAIAQVDLGRRAHRHQSLRDLGGMASQILAAVLARRAAHPVDGGVLRQFLHEGGQVVPADRLLSFVERPPAEEIGHR
ncbi:MAG TPA: glucosyl-3-phosphoglycerate synthase, partial [Nocardioides sp.]